MDFDISPEHIESLESSHFYTTDNSDDAMLSDSHDIMGYIVENDVIIGALSDNLVKCENVEFRKGISLTNVLQSQDKQV